MKKKRQSKIDHEAIIKVIIREMKVHGKMNPITSHDMCELLEAKGYSILDVTFRKYIKEIQFRGMLKFIVATERGFYYTTSLAHVRTQIDSLISREKSIAKVRKSLQSQVISLTK
jgi:hypothetical protein